jgi:hypothetical protein
MATINEISGPRADVNATKIDRGLTINMTNLSNLDLAHRNVNPIAGTIRADVAV